MRLLTAGLLALGLVGLPGQTALAQGQGLPQCALYAAQAAMPVLQEAYNWTNYGYAPLGPNGWNVLAQPFGAGPYGAAAFYGPPGLVAAYGPLGPGPTAQMIGQTLVPPGGFGFNAPAVNGFINFTTAASLAGLQQAELSNLSLRYSNAGIFQTAAATWRAGDAGLAGATLAVLNALCNGQLGTAAASAASADQGGR
jgi:hypothetical protein